MTSPVAELVIKLCHHRYFLVQQVLVKKVCFSGKSIPHGDSQAVVYTEDSSIDM